MPPDLYISTQSGLGFSASTQPPDSDYALMFSTGAGLGFTAVVSAGNGVPLAPDGFVLLVDTDGAYLVDDDGAFLMEAI